MPKPVKAPVETKTLNLIDDLDKPLVRFITAKGSDGVGIYRFTARGNAIEAGVYDPAAIRRLAKALLELAKLAEDTEPKDSKRRPTDWVLRSEIKHGEDVGLFLFWAGQGMRTLSLTDAKRFESEAAAGDYQRQYDIPRRYQPVPCGGGL